MSEPAPPDAGTAKLVSTPLRKELDRILAAQGEDRAFRLLASDHLAAAVALMPPEELFFTLKDLPPDDVPTVLAHARSRQVEFVLDLELWSRDRVRVDRIAPWLTVLAECPDGALARWLRHLDLATWTLLLGELVTVHLADEDRDPLQDLPGRPPFTLEGLYHVITEETQEPLVRRLLSTLRSIDDDRYYRLMEALVRDPGAELEEHCYQERGKRLALRGLPQWEEALEVYAILDVDRPDALPRRTHTLLRNLEEEPTAPPLYPVATSGTEPNLFQRALRQVGGERLEEVRAELAYVTNKVTVADGLDLDRVESFHGALNKVAAYLSVGLEALCGTDESKAASVLEHSWLQHLFRAGWTRVRAVRTKARRLFEQGWPQGRKERLLFLDPPLPEVFEGLLRRHPQWYAGSPDAPAYRWFRTLDELRRAEWCVDKAEFLGGFLLTAVDLRLEDLREALVQLPSESLRGSTVFLTSMVNAALGRDFRFAPVGRSAVREGLGRIWADDHPPRRVKPGLREAALKWARSLAPVTDREAEFLNEFVDDCLALLTEEFGHLAPDETPDPRFTRGIWIE